MAIQRPNIVILPEFSSPGPLRQATESLVLLAVAVILFRGFAAEGYLISTGSMAPTLLGYHHRVVCPECGLLFARGDFQGDHPHSSDTALADFDLGTIAPLPTRCPSCGCDHMSVSEVPRTEGDQLLVQKHAYEFRDPRRWEVIVFRNSEDPRQAYVKRVTGLPEETISIHQGEVLANGILCRKPYRVQDSLKILVSDYANRIPEGDPDRQSVWQAENAGSGWHLHPGHLIFDGLAAEHSLRSDWLAYRHWQAAPQDQVTAVQLAGWPNGLPLPEASDSLRYQEGLLQCQGTLTDRQRRDWLARSSDPRFQAAVEKLFEESHLSPIVDAYGYNPSDVPAINLQDEFFLSVTLDQVRGTGQFEIHLTDGENDFRALLNFGQKRLQILRNDDPVPIRDVEFQFAQDEPLTIDFSLFDDQVVLAINHVEQVESYPYERDDTPHAVTRPARVSARGLSFTVSSLQLFRDVHYTQKPDAPDEYHLGRDQFFVLGDNSPVSVDSRVWDDPAVSRSALIGKPLVVHLPSRTGCFSWGGRVHAIRIPDLSRVRLIR
jgi:signal peptidase I